MSYKSYVTEVGARKIADAIATGTVIIITSMAIGDGGGNAITPASDMTALVHEVARVDITSTEHDEAQNIITAVASISAEIGGWTIRELGLYDSDGDMIAVCNYPDTVKPVLTDGVASSVDVGMSIIVSSLAAVTIIVSDSVDLRPYESLPANIKMDATANVGTRNTVARGDHVHPIDTSRAPVSNPTFVGKVKIGNSTAAIWKGNDGELILECNKPYIFDGVGYRSLWHAGNDGAGSGLDADTLDGVEGGGYARTWHVGRHDNGTGWMKLCTIATGLPQGNKLTFLLAGAVGAYGLGTEATGHAQIDLTLLNDNTWVGTLYRIAFTTALLGVAIVPGTGSGVDVWINTPSYVDISALMFGNNTNYITPAQDIWTSTDPGGVVCNAYTIWTSGNDGEGSGMDSDTVDGYHVVSGVRPTSGLIKVGDYGVTGSATPMGAIDLNTLTAHGFYYGTYTAHSPTGSTSTSFYIVNIAEPASGYLLQCAWETATTGKMYQRVCYNGTWTAWSQYATTTDVSAAIAALVASSPAALDTLKELATALGNDPNFATTMTNALAAKAPLASPSFTGTPTAPPPDVADNGNRIATTSWFRSAIATITTALGFVYSFGPAGYIKLPSYLGGLLLQWGYVDLTGATISATWTFPTAFSSGWWYASAVANVQGTNGYASITSAQGGLTNLTFGRSDTGTNTRTLLFVLGK